jgi:hypothetical protein
VKALEAPPAQVGPKPQGFTSVEAKRQFLANPTRFPNDAEWNEMTPIEQASFLMALED